MRPCLYISPKLNKYVEFFFKTSVKKHLVRTNCYHTSLYIYKLIFQRAAARPQNKESINTASFVTSRSIPPDPQAVCNCCFVGTNRSPIKRDH